MHALCNAWKKACLACLIGYDTNGWMQTIISGRPHFPYFTLIFVFSIQSSRANSSCSSSVIQKMNSSYGTNSTPKNIHEMNYLEALMDFSTPRNTASTHWNLNPTMKNADESRRERSSEHLNNSSELNETMIFVHDNSQTTTNQLLQKFRQHESHFRSTQTSLQLLDQHLSELSTVLRQLQASLDQNSPLRTTTDQLESRLTQMSTKREQALCAINQWNHSPIISETLNDIIQQVRSLSLFIVSTSPIGFCTDLTQHPEVEYGRSLACLPRIDQSSGSSLQSETQPYRTLPAYPRSSAGFSFETPTATSIARPTDRKTSWSTARQWSISQNHRRGEAILRALRWASGGIWKVNRRISALARGKSISETPNERDYQDTLPFCQSSRRLEVLLLSCIYEFRQ